MKRHTVADARAMIEFIDPDVAKGRWTWELTAQGLEFKGQAPK